MATSILTNRSSNLSLLSAVNINYSTLTGSTIIDNTMTVNRIHYSTITGSSVATNSLLLASTLTGSSIILSGNVGIGTGSPTANLEIFGSGSGGFPLRLTSNVSGNEVAITFNRNPDRSSPTTGDVWIMGTSAYGVGDRNFGIGNNGTANVMTLKANGNVGIGTTNPILKFHVNGSSWFNGNELLRNENPLGVAGQYSMNAKFGNITSLYGGGILMYDYTRAANTGWAGVHNMITRIVDVTYMGYMSFGSLGDSAGIGLGSIGSASNDVLGPTSSTEKMCIQSNGNVGIGIITPSNKLHVDSGNIRVTTGANSGGAGGFIEFGVAQFASYSAMSNIGGYLEFTNTASTQLQGGLQFNVTPTNTGATATMFTAMRISGGGNVGIGTIDPVTRVHISGASSTYTNGQLFISDANDISNQLRLFSYWGISDRASFTSLQSIFNNSTASVLKINPAGGIVTIGPANVTAAAVETGTSSGLALVVNSTAIYGNGSVNITASSTGTRRDCITCTASIDGNYIISFHSAAGTLRGKIAGINDSSISYDSTSDRRLKTNISPIANAVEILQQLKPVTYTWIQNQATDFGFIAQDVHKVIPQFRNNVNSYTGCECTGTMNCTCYPDDEPVDSDGKPIYYGLDYGKFTPYIVKGIQEQQTVITAQQTEITDLKAQLAALKVTVDALVNSTRHLIL